MLAAALVFAIAAAVFLGLKALVSPRGRPSVAYVERKDGRSKVYTFGLKSGRSREIFSTPYEVRDVLVSDGNYFFATSINVADGRRNFTLPRRCEGEGVICAFGFIDGSLAYRYARIKPLATGYNIEIANYILNGGEFEFAAGFSANYPHLASVMGQAAKMSFDFDEGFISLARSSISTSRYLFAGNLGYSGFFTADGGNFVRYGRDGEEDILSGAWGQQDCFMKWSPGIFKKGEPNKYLVFRAEGYDIVFDAKASLDNWLLRDHFYIVRQGDECQQITVMPPGGGDIQLIPGRHKVIARTAGSPFVIYSLSGHPIHTFSENVSLIGFVRF